ncbi:MAG: hypothetical protein AAF202_13955, partial [Pseudomonadota bacterium]
MSGDVREDVVRRGYVLPGLPHLLLAAEKNSGWKKVREAYKKVRADLESSDIDVIVVYSTYWPSV